MRILKVMAALVMSLAILMTGMADASAHRGDQSYLYLDIGESLVARLQMPFPDVAEGLGIELEGDNIDTTQAIAENAQALQDYAADHVGLGTPDGSEWVLIVTGVSQVEDINYVEVAFDVVTQGPIPDEMQVRLDPFFDEIEARDALLLVGNDLRRGIVDQEDEQLVVLTPDNRSETFVLGDASQWKNFSASLGLGADHIRTGPDHMLFVVALMLPAVLIFRKGWHPAEGFVNTLWRLTKVLTMFTVAHSITFTLTGLGLVPSPGPKVTETIIALSIAATALHNLRPIMPNREWVIALVFGLFHGFGFASLVQDLDVSTTTQLVSLLGRNVGIELGQLFVVLVTFPALFLLRTTRFYRPIFVVGCIGLIIVSIGWAIERVFGGTEITSKVIDEITEFPRVLIFLAIGTAICLGVYLMERANNRLLPTVNRKETNIDLTTPERVATGV